jgi:hypothetical protein
MLVQIKPYQLFSEKKTFLIFFCLGITCFIVAISCAAAFMTEYYKILTKQNKDANEQLTLIEPSVKPSINLIIISAVFSVSFVILILILFRMYVNIFRFQKSLVFFLLSTLFVLGIALLILDIFYLSNEIQTCPTSYNLSDDGSSCNLSKYNPSSSDDDTSLSLKFWNGNSFASFDASDDLQKVSLNFTKDKQQTISGYLQMFNVGYIPDILQIFPLPTYNETKKLYFAYQYDDDEKKIVNTKYDWDSCPPEDLDSCCYNICDYPRDKSLRQTSKSSNSDNNLPPSFPDKISSIFFTNGIKMYIGKDNNFYILGNTACVKIYLDIYIDPIDTICNNGLVNISHYTCDGMGGWTSYFQKHYFLVFPLRTYLQRILRPKMIVQYNTTIVPSVTLQLLSRITI